MRYLIIILLFISCKQKSHYDKLKEDLKYLDEESIVNLTKEYCLGNIKKDSALSISYKLGIFIKIDSVKNHNELSQEVFFTVYNKSEKRIKHVNVALAFLFGNEYSLKRIISIDKDFDINESYNSSMYTEYFYGKDSLNFGFPVDVIFEKEKFELLPYDSIIRCK